jgi:hypothetical protein
MYCLPCCQQVRLPYFHQPDSLEDLTGFHAVNLNELYGFACRSQLNNYLCSTLHDVNVRWTVLAWRQENTDGEATGS